MDLDDEGACKEFATTLIFREFKQITLSIKLVTGYVSIKGADFQEWIDSNFCSISKLVPVDSEVVVEKETGKSEGCSTTKTDTSTEYDKHALLWEENDKLRNAIKILETSHKATLSAECKCSDKLEDLEEKLTRKFDQKAADLEKLYDGKLSIFTKTL